MQKATRLERLDRDMLNYKHIIWYITGHCKFKCTYCDVVDNKRPNTDLESQKKIVDTLFELKENFEIYLYGGEPTEYIYLHDILKYISKKNSKYFKGIELQTNLNVSIEEFKKIVSYKCITKIAPSIHITFLKGDTLDELVEKILIIEKNSKLNRIDFMLEKWFIDKHVEFNKKMINAKLGDYIQYVYNFFEHHTGKPYTGKWNADHVTEYKEMIDANAYEQERYKIFYEDKKTEELSINEMLLKNLSFKGRTCEARKFLVWVDFNGDWWECNISQAKNKPLGNLLKNPKHFLHTSNYPIKCRTEKCDACFFVKRY